MQNAFNFFFNLTDVRYATFFLIFILIMLILSGNSIANNDCCCKIEKDYYFTNQIITENILLEKLGICKLELQNVINDCIKYINEINSRHYDKQKFMKAFVLSQKYWELSFKANAEVIDFIYYEGSAKGIYILRYQLIEICDRINKLKSMFFYTPKDLE